VVFVSDAVADLWFEVWYGATLKSKSIDPKVVAQRNVRFQANWQNYASA